jgi:hypothetical protein
MPWCEDCAKYWTQSSVKTDGTCPTCGRPVAANLRDAVANENTERSAARVESNLSLSDVKRLAGQEAKAPWHFKLLMVALAGYLGWRFIQLIALAL